MPEKFEESFFGGGCFWCLEAVFSHIKGVESVISGYAGGNKINPTYEEVCNGQTGHAETIKIIYNESIINYEDLLKIFFYVHDPTTLNQQGNDVGTQYRSIILYANEKQHKIAENLINEINRQKIYAAPIITEIIPLEKFYPAEDYHQKYFEKNPDKAYCQIVIAPKVKKFQEIFKKYYK